MTAKKGKDEPSELSKRVEKMENNIKTMRTEIENLIGNLKPTGQETGTAEPRGGSTHRMTPSPGRQQPQGPVFQPAFGAPGVGAGLQGAAFGLGETQMPGFGGAGESTMMSPFAMAGGPSVEPRASARHKSTRDLSSMPPIVRQPAINVCDEGDDFCIQIELPGVKKDDLDVQISADRVTVDARAQLEDMGEGEVLFTERQPVEYRREIVLPVPVKTKGAKAKLKDGVLTVRADKSEPSARPEHVDVQTD